MLLVVFAYEIGHFCQQRDLRAIAGVKFLQFGDSVFIDWPIAVCGALQLFIVYDDQLLALTIVPCEVNVEFQHWAAQLQCRCETAKRILRRQARRTPMTNDGERVFILVAGVGFGYFRIYVGHVESGFGFD